MPPEDVPSDAVHLVLYDGTCGFCDRTVQWIMAADRRGEFHFAPLQGPTAAAVRARHPELPYDLDSVVYVDRSSDAERVYDRADAIIRIGRRLGGRASWVVVLDALPRALANAGYRLIARLRHRISGALGACPLPPATARARFLP